MEVLVAPGDLVVCVTVRPGKVRVMVSVRSDVVVHVARGLRAERDASHTQRGHVYMDVEGSRARVHYEQRRGAQHPHRVV